MFNANLLGGLALVVFGAGYLWVGQHYSLGSARNMGPGYFPLLIGVLIVLIGAILALQGLLRGGPRPGFWPRPVAAIGAAIAAFWAVIATFGLVPAIVATVALSALAEPGPRTIRVVLLSGVLVGMCWSIFVAALGLPLRMVRWP